MCKCKGFIQLGRRIKLDLKKLQTEIIIITFHTLLNIHVFFFICFPDYVITTDLLGK